MESYGSFFLLILSPIFIAAAGFWLLMRLQGEHKRKSPVSRKVLRYPGYSLVKKIEAQDERLTTDFTSLILIPAITVALVGLGIVDLKSFSTKLVVVASYIFGLGYFVVRLFRNVRQFRQDRLGLKGEQVVGHQLTELLRHGFYVFHDLPLDHENVDHVVVGPPGVFTIETKFKRKTADQKEGHVLTYDNSRIAFPDSGTSRPLEQAKRHSKELSNLLNRLFGSISVIPLVVYPGWFVKRKAKAVDVQVFNDKQIVGWLASEPLKLDDETVRRIAAFLEEKCRDVEI